MAFAAKAEIRKSFAFPGMTIRETALDAAIAGGMAAACFWAMDAPIGWGWAYFMVCWHSICHWGNPMAAWSA